MSKELEDRRQAVNYVKCCINLAREFDTKIVHILSGNLDVEVQPKEAFGWLTEATEECLDYSNDKNIVIAIEAVAGMLIHSIRDLYCLLEKSGLERLMVNFDPSHFHIAGDNLSEVVKVLGNRIVHAHLKDAVVRGSNYTFPLIGHGEIDFKKLLDDLSMVKFKGCCSLEYEGQVFGYEKDPIVVLKHSINFLKSYGYF